MPITSIASYIPTTLAFQTNWTQANLELGTSPLILAGDYTLAQFTTDRDALLTLMDTVSTLADAALVAQSARDTMRLNLLMRHKQFRGTIQGTISNPDTLAEVPPQPDGRADASKFAAPFKTIAALWGRINANPSAYGLSGPLFIGGGWNLNSFQEAVDAIIPAYDAVQTAEEAVGIARTKRDNAMAAIYERLKQYRGLLPTLLPANSPAVMSMPRLTPPPGTTPPPVIVTGVWDAVLVKAHLTWPAATAPDVDKLQVRACTGGTYKADDEEIVTDLDADATHYETDWGLTVPGSLAAFKVYVMATTGNENGGKAVKIVRPVT